MPYITREDRKRVGYLTDTITGYQKRGVITVGMLNYLISKLCKAYVDQYNSGSYSLYNDVVGVLENAKFEYIRRCVSPYEDRKIEENGDIYVD